MLIVYNIINTDLNFKMHKKYNVLRLAGDSAESTTQCRIYNPFIRKKKMEKFYYNKGSLFK